LLGATNFINDYLLDQKMKVDDIKGAFDLSTIDTTTLPLAASRFEQLSGEVERFLSKVGFSFRTKELFIQALTHKSLVPSSEPYSYSAILERLEFLGDSLIKFLAGVHFYNIKRDAQEGDLSAYRANVIKNATLGQKCKEIGLDKLLLYHRC
jgi:dsRNA-specific ribonuclease